MLFHQMTHISRDRGSLAHEDRLEALAGAVKYWTEVMGQDAAEEEKSHRAALLDKELEDFMEHCLGRPSKPVGWIAGMLR